MKKYLFGLFALVLAVGISAYTAPKKVFANKYLVYDTGTKTLVGSYTPQDTEPTLACSGISQVCWLKVEDLNSNGTISQTEFDAAFEAIDEGANPGDGSIDDDGEIDHVFQKKS
jgi:hypothetical protein